MDLYCVAFDINGCDCTEFCKLDDVQRARHEAKPVTEYWLKHYAGETFTSCCTLCGNHGVIDARGVCSPAGSPSGALNYCICPNGQVLRQKQVPLEGLAVRQKQVSFPDRS